MNIVNAWEEGGWEWVVEAHPSYEGGVALTLLKRPKGGTFHKWTPQNWMDFAPPFNMTIGYFSPVKITIFHYSDWIDKMLYGTFEHRVNKVVARMKKIATAFVKCQDAEAARRKKSQDLINRIKQ